MQKNRSAFLLVILALVVTGSMAFFYFYHLTYFLPGVYIASIPVEGKDREEVCALVKQWIDELYAVSVTFSADQYKYQTYLGDICVPVDVEQAVGEIWQKEKERNLKNKLSLISSSEKIAYPVSIQYDHAILTRLQEKWNLELAIKPVNATLTVDEEEGLIIVPGRFGREIDFDNTFSNLTVQWEEISPLNISIAMKKVLPTVTAADLQVMGELAYYSTWYNLKETDRSHNLRLAASLLNGVAVKPGEEFSFNSIVGPRTYETGYRDALIITSGKFEPGVGGGICQVSSTLYNACLLAGLDIVERHNHALAVAYVPLGQDATVAYGLQDFRFLNNTNYPIYLRSNAEGGQLSIYIYGHLDNKKYIKVYNMVDKTIEYQEIRELDTTLEPGEEKIDQNGANGYIVRTFRSFTDESGQLLDEEFLATDHYRPLDKIILVGPLPEEEEQNRQEEFEQGQEPHTNFITNN